MTLVAKDSQKILLCLSILSLKIYLYLSRYGIWSIYQVSVERGVFRIFLDLEMAQPALAGLVNGSEDIRCSTVVSSSLGPP